MDVYLTDVYEYEGVDDNSKFLYQLLKERPKCCYISHKKLPTFDRHDTFVRSMPYKDWQIINIWDTTCENQIIEDGGGGFIKVGSVYLTNANEIGIFILKKYRGKGLAKAALKLFMSQHKGPFLANINPANIKSIVLFKRLGFRHIQNTYRSK